MPYIFPKAAKFNFQVIPRDRRNSAGIVRATFRAHPPIPPTVRLFGHPVLPVKHQRFNMVRASWVLSIQLQTTNVYREKEEKPIKCSFYRPLAYLYSYRVVFGKGALNFVTFSFFGTCVIYY